MFRTVEQMIHRYLLLVCIAGGVTGAMLLPGPGEFLASLNINPLLIGGIFLVQGMEMDTSGIKNVRAFLPTIGMGIIIALVLYPIVADLISRLFDLDKDNTIGLILMTSMPTTLAAAIPMTVSAGGDPLTSVILIIFLNIAGLATIPANLHIWLGSHTSIAPLSILMTLLVCLFLPMGAGQLARKIKPDFTARIHLRIRNLPNILLGLLVYIACVKEADLFAGIKLIQLARLILPCLTAHLIMLVLACIASIKVLKLPKDRRRSFTLICSEKPVTLAIALWSVHFSGSHPLAVFPLLIFYILQMVTDSLAASSITKLKTEQPAAE